MQTFMPYDTYLRSARVLDRQRLGKQRVEVLQIASAILDPSYGWNSHPAVNMWRGHGAALLTYGLVVCEEWRRHGYKDTCLGKLVNLMPMMISMGERITRPPWWGDPAVHDSHKSRLFWKNPEYYEFWYTYQDIEDYVWPSGTDRIKNRKEERLPVTMSQLVCRGMGCGRRPGFTNLGNARNPWWVCGNCHRPTEAWFKAQGDDVLNMFRDGPLSGLVYDSRTLLGDARLANIVLQYRWTPEILNSETTGRKARVWLHTTDAPDSVTQSAQPVQHALNQGVKLTAEAPAVPETPDVPNATPAEPVAVKEPVDVSDLLTTRTGLKLSRTTVANKADVTVAQLYRIEQGGRKTTQDEADKVRQALRELKSENEAAAAAAPVAGAEGTANPA